MSCNFCNITQDQRIAMSVQQRQELTVMILHEFVARQDEVHRTTAKPVLNTVPDALHYVDTQPGDL